MKITFDEVSIRARKVVRCEVCNKRLVRSKKFYQTLNPFNRTEQGFPKSRERIMSELRKSVSEWGVSPETCGNKHTKEGA